MKCVILCAGYGTRLYPLALNTPKPLLEIAGRPLLDHILERVEDIGDIDEILVVTNGKFFGKFNEWAKNRKDKRLKLINDKTSSEENRLGAIGDIDFAIRQEKIDDDLFVIAGDNLFEFSLKHLYNFFTKKHASVIALYDIGEKNIASKKFGVVEIDSASRVIGFEEKPEYPKTSLISTACYILAKKDVRLLEQCIIEHKRPDNLGDFIKWLSTKEHVYGYVFFERWFDIGSNEQLQEAEEYWRED